MNKHPLEQVKWGVLPINYKGCLVYKLIGGYSIFGKKCLTVKDVDDIINASLKSIEKSIK